jgi:hypothetical protein
MAKNGKAKTKAKAETKPKAKSKKGRRPEGGLGLRDDERQALHFRHVREFEAAQAIKKAADNDFKSVKDRIKDEGGSIGAIELTLKLRTEEGQEAFKAMMAEQAEVAKWNGVGVQIELFGKDADPIYEDGKRAAMNDEPAKPPGHLAQKAQQRWLSGHADGRVALNATRAENFHRPDPASIGEVAADLVSRLGDQPPAEQLAH